MTSLVIFDFDGTLFDTHESIEHSIKLTFSSLLPTHDPAQSDVHRLISSGAGLADTFRALHPNPATFDTAEDRWISEYRRIYAQHGQSLIKSYPGAKQLLEHLRDCGVPVGIISNKGVQAVHTALQDNGLTGLVSEDLVVGDKTPGATRKPDAGSFTNVLAPALRSLHGVDSVDPSKVLVVGDTVADIQFASSVGARSCWCRYGYGSAAECNRLQPDFTVDSLAEVIHVMRSGKQGNMY